MPALPEDWPGKWHAMIDQELLQAYEPVLCFAHSERFFPMDVKHYLSYRPCWRGGSSCFHPKPGGSSIKVCGASRACSQANPARQDRGGSAVKEVNRRKKGDVGETHWDGCITWRRASPARWADPLALGSHI